MGGSLKHSSQVQRFQAGSQPGYEVRFQVGYQAAFKVGSQAGSQVPVGCPED